MLEQHEVAAYLLERRLVARRSVVSGLLRIADASSRNRNFRVSGGPGESYLLKQGVAAGSVQSLANEVALYRRLATGASPMATCIPRLYGYDAARGVLILEWIADGQDLYRHHAARARCSRPLAAALGRVLARLHAVAPDEEELRRDAPWVLSLHRPPIDALRHLSAASIELVKLIQRDERFARGLDELRDGWRVETLVHRDVKWANCIAHAPAGGTRPTAVALVDWEMAGWGDPALDVGSAFGELIGHRLDAVPQPAGAALWHAYVRARRLDEEGAARLLDRAVRYAAARLVQSAYEDTQEAGLTTARVARSLQLGREILSSPRAATTDLLGIAP